MLQKNIARVALSFALLATIAGCSKGEDSTSTSTSTDAAGNTTTTQTKSSGGDSTSTTVKSSGGDMTTMSPTPGAAMTTAP